MSLLVWLRGLRLSFASAGAMSQARYRALTREAGAELREKGSRFYALLQVAESEDQARALIRSVCESHADASHVCWAWRLGSPPSERCSDAGEPAGTAGQPMLRVLAGADISQVVATVVRYFGGTKLGKGGLARAYAGVVKAALEGASVVERMPTIRWSVTVDYEQLGAIQKLVQPPTVALEAREYGELAHIDLEVSCERADSVREWLERLGVELADGSQDV